MTPRNFRRLLNRSLSGRRPTPAPTVHYVFAVPAGDLVAVRWTKDLARDIKLIKRHVPDAGAGYLLALPDTIDPRAVSDLARLKLEAKAAGGGWFHCSLEEATRAIEAASAECGHPVAFETTSAALGGNQKRA